MKNATNRKTRTLAMVEFAMLLAIEAIVCFTPLGSIPIGPLVATLMMIPVIITAITLGTAAGTAMGFIAGLFSFIVWTFMPPSPLAVVFTPFYSFAGFHGNGWSLVICFVPRILAGTVTGVVFKLLLKRGKVVSYVLSGVLGSLVNTVLVLGGIFVFFAPAFAAVNKAGTGAVLGIIGASVLTNGIPELVLSGIVAYAVGYPLRRYRNRI